MTHDPSDRSPALRLITATLSDFADLVRKETRLACAEMAERASAGLRAAVWTTIAGVLGFVALLAAVEGVILVIASFGLALRWSCFVVAAALLVIALIIWLAARSGGLAPVRTLTQLRKDVRTVKEQAR